MTNQTCTQSELQPLIEKIVSQGKNHLLPTFEQTHEDEQAQGLIVRRSMPSRRLLLQRHHKAGCPFCRRPATEFLIELPYQGLLLSQNIAPYDPISLLLRSYEHFTQADCTDMLERIGPTILKELPENYSLICNQMAGNSQEHFHFQYIGRLLPIAKVTPSIDGLWQASGIGKAHHAILDGLNQHAKPSKELPLDHFLGYLVRGTAIEATRCAVAYLREAFHQGFERYNFTIWKGEEINQYFVFIVLRNEKTLRHQHDQFPSVIGALTVSGLIMYGKPLNTLEPFDYQAFTAYLRNKIIEPIKFQNLGH